jgi:hypothetical protein
LGAERIILWNIAFAVAVLNLLLTTVHNPMALSGKYDIAPSAIGLIEMRFLWIDFVVIVESWVMTMVLITMSV